MKLRNVILDIGEMVNLKQRTIIKNSGVIIATLTFVVGAIYTILDLHIIVLGGGISIFLRLLGIITIIAIAYLPYFIFQKSLEYTRYPIFLWCVGIIFFIGDIIVRIDLVVSVLSVPGFVGVVVYPLIFTSMIGALRLCEIIVRRCRHKNHRCYKISLSMRKKYSAFLLKVRRI